MFLIAQWTREWIEHEKYPFMYYQSIESTNDEAKKAFDDQKNIFLFIAELQTQGRGRRQNKWLNSDMMLSWSFPFRKVPQPTLSRQMGTALCSSLKNTWPSINFKLKLPNDILINRKKLSGLLIEVISKGEQHRLIMGVGMNVFKHPLDTPFTHLAEYLPEKEINKSKWFSFMNNWYDEIQKVIQLYMQ